MAAPPVDIALQISAGLSPLWRVKTMVLPSGGELHVVERVVAGDGDARASAVEGDELNGLMAAILDGEEQTLRIGRPGEAVDGAVDGVGRNGQLSGRAFEDEETPAIALISGARLGTVGEILAVGRIQRRIVGAGIAGDLVAPCRPEWGRRRDRCWCRRRGCRRCSWRSRLRRRRERWRSRRDRRAKRAGRHAMPGERSATLPSASEMESRWLRRLPSQVVQWR